jgi:hypothetical protein
MMLFPENSWQRWGVWLSRKCGRPDDLNAAATARFNLMSCKSSMPHIPLPAKHLSGRRLCACVLLIMAAAMALADAPVRAAAHRTAENYARMRENGVRIAEPPPPSLVAALRTSGTAAIAAWEARAGADAVEIVEWARRQ